MLILKMVYETINFFIFWKLFSPFTELAGLAEQEFGIESTAMYDDLHAPSVPVQPVNMETTRVSNSLKYI